MNFESNTYKKVVFLTNNYKHVHHFIYLFFIGQEILISQHFYILITTNFGRT